MNDHQLRDAYERLLDRDAPADRAGCAPPEALRALVERKGAEAERLEALDHVMGCNRCRREFDLLRTVAATRPRPAAWSRTVLAAAAMIAVVAGGVLTWQMSGSGGQAEDVLRAGGSALALVAPADGAVVEGDAVLTWRSVADAARYEVVVTDSAGRSLYSGSTRDTTATTQVPPSAGAGEVRIWWVEAVLLDGRRIRSPATRFTLRR